MSEAGPVRADDRVELQQHDRPSHAEQIDVGRTDPKCEMQVTLVLRRDPNISLPGAEAHLDEIEAVAGYVEVFSLTVVSKSAERRAVTVTGTAEKMERAFGVELIDVEVRGKRFRRFSNAPKLPTPFDQTVVGVLGLRARPITSKLRVHHSNTTAPFWGVNDVAEAYEFPLEADGTGQTIGLIELGGGYNQSDLDAYFGALGMSANRVSFISVDGAVNDPAPAESIQKFLDVVEGRCTPESVDPDVLARAQATIEVTMDIELAGALAPGAQIVVYMAPMTEQGMFNALSRAVSKEAPLVDVVSMSWGDPEPRVSDAYLLAINDILADAAQRGITVCASSGDNGADNDSPDGQPCVNFPASSPYALACGGSTVVRVDSKIDKERVWNCGVHGIPAATGGGVSRRFGLPEWQQGIGVPLSPTGFAGRGVPDVAGPADPHNGCDILVANIRCSSAGTSAVAPLWAALIARYNQLLQRRCGHLHSHLYEGPFVPGELPFRSITQGDNGAYRAGKGWNACTGLGTPRGRALLGHLRDARRAA